MQQHTPLVVLDVETTGFKPEDGHEIIEVAAQRIVREEVVGEFVALVKPTRPVTEETVRINGITQALLDAEGKAPRDVFPALVAFIGTTTVVGHNVQFDLGFINAHLEKLGMPKLANPTMDTVDISRRLLILPSYALEKVALYLKVPQPKAHRALADVVTTRQVLLKLFERAGR